MIRKVDHVGIAVRSLEESLRLWRDRLGLEHEGTESVPAEGVRIGFLRAGETRIELLEPAGAGSPIERHIDKRGEGIHHVTFEVDDLDETLARLAEGGTEVLGDGPRAGEGGRRVAFLHPRSCGGVLVELAAPKPGRAEHALEAGRPVLLYLRDPHERLWGVLRGIDAMGVTVEGIDLASFEDWAAQVERGDASVVGPSLLFFPMLRVERVLLDRASGDLPSLADRFRARTGRTVQDVLDEGLT